MRAGLGPVLLLCVSGLHAQEAPVVTPAEAAEFHAEVRALYDFTPGTLPRDKMEAKSGELDAFWKKVKGRPTTLGHSLRRELARDDAPAFFLYDGSMLLLDLNASASRAKSEPSGEVAPVDKDDAKLVIACLARCPLAGIQHDDYLRKVHWLACEGNDTTAAALHALDEPTFQAFIAQHALTLGQEYSVLYMLMPTDEAFWLQPAVERVKTERDEKASTSLLKVLWYAATDASDAAILQASEDAARPEAVRMAAGKLVRQTQTLSTSLQAEDRAKLAQALGVAVDATVVELKAARRRRMQDDISDEALGDLDRFTLLIRSRAP